MKKIYLILILFSFLIQFSFLPMLDWSFQIPNLILIIVTIIGIRKSLIESFGWFLLAGFIFEIFSVEIFGFNLILFTLIGSSVWFFRNIILNKENNILIEILFWFLVKVVWDLFYTIEVFFWGLFSKGQGSGELIIFSINYLKEMVIFILSGVLITILWSHFRGDSSRATSGPSVQLKMSNFNKFIKKLF